MRRLHSRRGFTLVELLVYVGLVSAGVLMIGGVEMFAQRSLRLQQGLIEVELQSVSFGGQLRTDVEAARSLSTEGDELRILTLSGEQVRYRPGERVVLDRDGEVDHRDAAPQLTACSFTLERLDSGRVRVTADLEFDLRVDADTQLRKRTRTATTRLAVIE